MKKLKPYNRERPALVFGDYRRFFWAFGLMREPVISTLWLGYFHISWSEDGGPASFYHDRPFSIGLNRD